MQVFFRMVSFLLANELRLLVKKSLSDFVQMFDANVTTAASLIKNATPLSFIIRMVLDDTTIRLDPSVEDVQSTAESFIDQILTCVDQIPKIETQLFSNFANSSLGNPGGYNTQNSRMVGNVNQTLKPENCINVAFEDTYPSFVKKCRQDLAKCVKQQLQFPTDYLSEFDKHRSLIDKSVYKDVENLISGEFHAEHLMEVRKIVHAFIFSGN